LSGWWYRTVNFGQYRREIKTTPKRRTNEVSILEVEAVQLVASLLRVGYVFIDNEGGALGVVGDTLSNLANGAKFSEEVE
jgi:hypothetical protein